MKRILVLIIFLLFLVPYALTAEFWASKNSNKYHYPDCKWAQKIKSENLVKFKTPEDAIKAGYVPCKVCKPPISSKTQLNDIKPITVGFESIDLEQRSGCCSWHGGVCGCDNSTCRVICCDGTLSPSCTCC